MLLQCLCKLAKLCCTTWQAQTHSHNTAALSLIIHYTRRNAHIEDETIKKDLSLRVSLALKFSVECRHIFKNGQQKTFSAKRPSKDVQTVNPKILRTNIRNLAPKRPTWQPCRCGRIRLHSTSAHVCWRGICLQ